MDNQIEKTLNKLEYADTGEGFTGYFNAQEFLILHELGLGLVKNHDKRVLVAKYEKKLGLCDGRWMDFNKPKKKVLEIIVSTIGDRL